VDQICDHVIVMASGRALATGTMAQVRANQDVVDAYLGEYSRNLSTAMRKSIIFAPGTRNPLFLRIKAAAYGRALTVVGEPEATALGAALMGGLAAGIWPDLDAAQAEMVQARHVVEPDADWTVRYGELFEQVYRRLYPALAPLSHALARFDTPPT